MTPKDLVFAGRSFNRWTLIEKCAPTFAFKGSWWLVQCSCGNYGRAPESRLKSGKTKQCKSCAATAIQDRRRLKESMSFGRKLGITKQDRANRNKWNQHVASTMINAKLRRVEIGFSSTAEMASYIESIAPIRCPVFGTELHHGAGDLVGRFSIDRIDNTKGYVRGNLQVISYKANVMKSDANQDQLKMFADWINNTVSKA